MNADPDPAKAIFLEAVERHVPDQWPAFLDRACAGQPDLRGRVESLLEAHREIASAQHVEFAEVADTRLVATADEPVREAPGTVIGPYKLLEQIGEGGFGVVFLAEQTEPVRRKVALKILKPGMDTRQVVARFEAERQALAIMDHPNIAKVFDGGATASGRPYFVMELVKGVPITEFCDQNRLTPRQRLELFLPVCQAVQHAHQKGIIHRDLKPSNVLVSRHDTTPAVKVIDFGVAKALGQVLTDKTLFTGVAQMVGTPLYMSPEQASMSDLDIDTRSDIYSLGVLLYELLTGTTPFSKERFKEAAYDEIRRIIREEEPPKPSTRLSDSKDSLPSISAQRHTEPAKLTKLVRGELDWIVMKCLEKDRNRRYETANSFAMDVQRYLADEQVLACPPSAGYRLRKFLRKHRRPVAAGVSLLTVVLVGTALITWQAIRATIAEKKALQAATNESAAHKLAVTLRQQAEHEAAAAAMAAAREKKQREEAEAARDEKDRALLRSEGLRLSAESSLVLPHNPDLALLLAIEGARRHPAHVTNRAVLAAMDAGYEHKTLLGHNASILSASFNHDGTRVLTAQGASGNMPARIWDAATGKELGTMMGMRPIQWAIFSPRGQRIVTGEMDSMVRVWDGATAKELFAFRGRVHGAESNVFSANDQKLVIPAGNNTARVVEATNGKELLVLAGHQGFVSSASFSPDGQKIVTTSQDQTVRIWDANSGEQLIKVDWLQGRMQSGARSSSGAPLPEQISSARFSPNGLWVLTTSSDNTGRLWDAKTGKEIRTLPYLGAYGHVDISPDSKRILHFSGGDQFAFIEIRDLSTGEKVLKLQGHERGITSAKFSPDGKRVVSTSDDQTVRIWDAANGEQLAVLKGHQGRVMTARFSPDGRFVVSGGEDATARIWHMASGPESASLPVPKVSSPVVAISGDGRRLIALSDMQLATSVWNIETGKEITLSRRAIGGSFSPDGRRILTEQGNLFDADSGQPLLSLVGHTDTVIASRFNTDGTLIVTGSKDRTVRVWEAATGNSLAVLRGHTDSLADVAFSFDGKLVISGSVDGSARIWEWKVSKEMWLLKGHADRVTSAAFSPDGKFALTVGRDRTARIWDVTNGQALATLKDPIGINEAAISSDSKQVLTWQSFTNPLVRVWSLPRGEAVATLKHDGPVRIAIFSAHGKQIFTAADDSTARIWDAATGKEQVRLKEGKQIGYAAFGPDGKQLLGATAYAAHLWDATTGERLKTVIANTGSFRSVGFSPDGKRVLAGVLSHGASIWEIASRQKIVDLQGGHGWQIWHMAFSPDGSKVVTASFDGTARLWDAQSGRELALLAGHDGRLNFADFSPDGTKIVTSSDDATARLWDAVTGKPLQLLGGHTDEVKFAKFDTQSKRVLTSSMDATARLWDVATGKELFKFEHGSSIGAADFSPDGQRIVTASTGWLPMHESRDGKRTTTGSRRAQDTTARIWDAGSGNQLLVLEHEQGINSAVFTPEGTRLITASDEVLIWDAANGQKLKALKGFKGSIGRVAISRDGKGILGVTFDQSVELWDAQSGRHQVSLDIRGGAYLAMFAPDGQQIVTVSRDGAIRFWPVDPLGAAVKRKSRDLTAEERQRYSITEVAK